MLSIKKNYIVIYALMGVCFLLAAVTSQAVEINIQKAEYAKSQEQMGREIMQASWLRWSQGRVQEELGHLIQEGGPESNIAQETLGSGIAAAAHLNWAQGKSQERIGGSIVRIAQIVAQEAGLLVGKIQEGFGKIILEEAQADFLTSQEVLGKRILQQAQIDYSIGIMTSALRSALEGKKTAPISKEVVDIAKRNGGYRQLSNFALAVSLLEGDTGMTPSHLLPSRFTTTSGTVTASSSERGWGGFAEFGIFAIAGILFMMYSAVSQIQSDGPPMAGKDEVPWKLQKAA